MGNAQACVSGAYDMRAGWMAAVSAVHRAFIGAERRENEGRIRVYLRL
jgi:hypothetical protein